MSHLRMVVKTERVKAPIEAPGAERNLAGAIIEADTRRLNGGDVADIIADVRAHELVSECTTPIYKRALAILIERHDRGESNDFIAAADAFREAGLFVGSSTNERATPDITGWMEDVLRMADEPILYLAQRYAKEIRECAARRDLLLYARALVDNLEYETRPLAKWFDEAMAPLVAMTAAESARASLLTKPAEDETITMGQAVEQMVSRVTNPSRQCIATPFATMNYNLIGGMKPGKLIYLAARPSIGKSALCLEFARRAARHGKRTLYVSLESDGADVAIRTTAQQGQHDSTSIAMGHISEEVQRTLGEVARLPIVITSANALPKIQRIMQQSSEPFEFLIVDYLQLMAAPDSIRDRRHQVEWVSRALKHLAMQHQIPVLALLSVTRTTSEGVEKAPTLASLRESGQLEHDADVVMLLHRERDRIETECIIAKNRDGRTGVVNLGFFAETVSFRELTHDEEQP